MEALCYSFFIFSFAQLNGFVSSQVVYTDHGAIEGTTFETLSGRVVRAFLGIPYADPPVFERRFKDPFLKAYWEGVLPAKSFGGRCVQLSYIQYINPLIGGEEDCLYLNIYTPTISNTTKLDVLFFIHGGQFVRGSGAMYTPDFIMDQHNVVFVTINYRLGPLGFLSTEDEALPGNYGLKDQVAALKWVRNNINQFGGDKDKITLMGHDAGAASVHLHYISPLSQKLFKQGISLSGSAFCPWALIKNARYNTKELANYLGCDSVHNSYELVECMQLREPFKILDSAAHLFMPWSLIPFLPFGPVIEKETDTSFLPKHPYTLVEEEKVKDAPWLVGLTTHEGLYPGAGFIRNHDFLEEIDDNWHNIAPYLLNYNNTVPRDMLRSVNEKIRQFYFEDKEISVKLRRELITMLSDRLYVADIERAARMHASVLKKSYVFLYKFGYRGRYSKAHPLCNCTEDLGVSHGDDLLYLFRTKGLDVTDWDYGKAMMREMVNVIMTFVKRGIAKTDEQTIWKPVTQRAMKGHNIHYMEIATSESLELEESPDLGNRRFWESLHLAELKNVKDDHKRFFDEF